MSEVLLFHHAQGLTKGVRAFADDLRASGHIVHTPDLFEDARSRISTGLAYIGRIEYDEMRERGVRLADDLPPELVYAGFSFGVLPVQKLAQTRPGARGALLFYSCLPITGEWGFWPWPDGVAIQIHGMDSDPIFVGEATSTQPAGSCRRSRTRNFSCTPAISTASPTTRSHPMT